MTDQARTEQTKAPRPDAYERDVAAESLILGAQELVCKMLEDKAMSRADLARKLGVSRGFVTQLLSGERNMTLRTLAEIAHACGETLSIKPGAASPPLSGEVEELVARLRSLMPGAFPGRENTTVWKAADALVAEHRRAEAAERVVRAAQAVSDSTFDDGDNIYADDHCLGELREALAALSDPKETGTEPSVGDAT